MTFTDFLKGAAAVTGAVVMGAAQLAADSQIVDDEVKRYRMNALDESYKWRGDMTEDEYIIRKLIKEKLVKEGRIGEYNL